MEARRQHWAIATAILVVAAACTTTGGPGGRATSTPFVYPTDTHKNGPASGNWSGTITFHGVIDSDEEKPIDCHDPNNVYDCDTGIETKAIHLDTTDTFNVTGDDDQLRGGVGSVILMGTVATSGSTNQLTKAHLNTQNSQCTWTQDGGDDITGSWSDDGDADGELRFDDDGTYHIEILRGHVVPATVPHRTWVTYSNISANCEPKVQPYDRTVDGSPLDQLVSNHLGDRDINDELIFIEGTPITANPDGTLDGTSTWTRDLLGDLGGLLADPGPPILLTITITWHLVHGEAR